MSQDTMHRAYCDGCDYCEPVDLRVTAIADSTPDPSDDAVNHPRHYTSHPARCECGSGIECITIAEHYGFNVGNAIKYLWRAGLKGDAIEDLRKAAWYLGREIEKREKEAKVAEDARKSGETTAGGSKANGTITHGKGV